MQSRFEFLEDQFPKIAKLGKHAEEALNSDNNICLLYLGRIAETITEFLCRSNNIIEENLAVQDAVIELARLNVIDAEIERKINSLIEIKNEAYENNYDSEIACSHLITTAQELCEWFALKHSEGRFEFLAELFPPDFVPPLANLAEIGREAEENLYINTRYCLICLGDIGEAVVDYLLTVNNIPAQRDHLDRINVLFTLGIITNELKDSLHNLRMARNDAVHERYNNTYMSEDEVKNLLDEALKLCEWLFRLVIQPGYILKGRLSDITEDSISVLIGSMPAYVPSSEIPLDEAGKIKDSYIKGRKYVFKVLEKSDEIIILSLRQADEDYKFNISNVKQKYSRYRKGQDVKVRVIRLSNSIGALVELKNGLPAQIPPSEIIGRKLYAYDEAGSKQIRYEVTARVKGFIPAKYPPMILSLKDIERKFRHGAQAAAKDDKAGKEAKEGTKTIKDLDFITFCKNSANEKIIKLLDAGANPNAKNNNNTTALMMAAESNKDFKVHAALIEAGAKVNAQNKKGNTPLHFAAMKNSPEVIALLIDKGADIEAVNKEKKKPIDYARSNKKLKDSEILQILTSQGITASKPIETVSTSDVQPAQAPAEETKSTSSIRKDFLKICRSGTEADIAAAILDGVNVNSKNKALTTALMFAARYNTSEAVSMLLEAGTYINSQDIYGNTALIYAASSNTPDVVETLLNAGADIEITNTSGFSAFDYGNKNPKLAATETLQKLL